MEAEYRAVTSMKRYLLSAACLAIIGAAGIVRAQTSTNVTPALAAKYATEEERYSYAVGVMIAADMRRNLSRARKSTTRRGRGGSETRKVALLPLSRAAPSIRRRGRGGWGVSSAE